METGWTSNATDSAIGKSDYFVTYTGGLELVQESDDFALRGSLQFSETRYRNQEFENDRSVGFDLAVGKQVSEEFLLRGSLSLVSASLGDDLNLGGLYLATRTHKTTAEAIGEAVLQLPGQEFRLSVTYGATRPEDTRFPGLPLLPVRLSAVVDTLASALAFKQTLTPEVAMTAATVLRLTGISEADREAYLRTPVHALRVTGGLEANLAGRVSIAADGGVEVLWSEDWPEVRAAPHLTAGLQAALSEALSLNLAAGTRVELADPIDGAASSIHEASATLSFAMTEAITVSASASAEIEQGIVDPELTDQKFVVAAGLEHRLGDISSYGMTLSRTHYVASINSYDKTQLSVTVRGRI